MVAQLLDALELLVTDEANVARPPASTLGFLNLKRELLTGLARKTPNPKNPAKKNFIIPPKSGGFYF